MKRHRRHDEASEEMLTLSFLDTLCCCLGATVLLFVALVSTPTTDSGATRRARGHFLRVVYSSSDPSAILHFAVRTPAGKIIELKPADFDRDLYKNNLAVWRALRVIGLSNVSKPLDGTEQQYEVLISDPAVGRWQFLARYADRTDPIELLSTSAPVKIVRRATASFKLTASPMRASLGFAETMCTTGRCEEIEVPPEAAATP